MTPGSKGQKADVSSLARRFLTSLPSKDIRKPLRHTFKAQGLSIFDQH